jgi:hypothetical protein
VTATPLIATTRQGLTLMQGPVVWDRAGPLASDRRPLAGCHATDARPQSHLVPQPNPV